MMKHAWFNLNYSFDFKIPKCFFLYSQGSFETLLGVLGIRDNWTGSTFRDNALGTFRDKG